MLENLLIALLYIIMNTIALVAGIIIIAVSDKIFSNLKIFLYNNKTMKISH